MLECKVVSSSQRALEDLTCFESVLSVKTDPAIDSADLDADHVLVSVLRSKVAHALCLFDPRVPDHCVLEIIAYDIHSRFSVDDNRSCVLLDILVHAVDFSSDRELIAGRTVLGRVLNLVYELQSRQTSDFSL